MFLVRMRTAHAVTYTWVPWSITPTILWFNSHFHIPQFLSWGLQRQWRSSVWSRIIYGV